MGLLSRSKYSWLTLGFAISLMTFATIVILAEIQKHFPHGKNLIPREYVQFFVNFLPGQLFTDLIFLYVIPVGVVLLFLAVGVPIVMGLARIHRLTHRGAKFGVSPLGPTVSSKKLFARTLFVGLFAFSLTVLIVKAGYGSLFRNISMTPGDPSLITATSLYQGEAIFIGTFFIVGVLLLALLPFWLMEDAGLLMYDVRPAARHIPNVSGVHLWYVDLFEGYAGISAILALAQLIWGALSEVSPGDPALLTPVILIGLPLITSGLLTIPMILYEKSLPKMLKKLQIKLDASQYPEVAIPPQAKVIVSRASSPQGLASTSGILTTGGEPPTAP